MVRETRHLWVGNLPENIREDRIREHFKRYGRVQSVKLLPPSSGTSSGSGSEESSGGGGGLCATVAFMDIKSASKAHTAEHKLDERSLTTEYYEPPTASMLHLHEPQQSPASAPASGSTSTVGSAGATLYPPRSPRFPPHGPAEETFERSSHFYRGGSGSVAPGAETEASSGYLPRRGGNGAPAPAGSGPAYHAAAATSDGLRGRTRDRQQAVYRNGPTYPPSHLETGGRGAPATSHHRAGSGGGSAWNYDGVTGGVRYPAGGDPEEPPLAGTRQPAPCTPSSPATAAATSPSQAAPPAPAALLTLSSASASAARKSRHAKRRRGTARSSAAVTSGGVSDSEHSSGRGSRSTSRSSCSSSHSTNSSSSSCSSPSSSPGGSPGTRGQRASSRLLASMPPPSCGTGSHHNSSSSSGSGATHADDRRPLAICVRNLPARSSDTSLKDGLFHEYKKHGKVTWVKVVGSGSDRYALVCFKKPEDVDKALEVSHDKLFFGCKIDVAPYEGFDVDDNDFRVCFVDRPYEAELDEFHPKATRTLFIGNLEKDVTAAELRKHFEQFGEIIEIDIKKQGSVSSYAFCQYADIGAVVAAMRSMDGEHLGNNRIKLGFGKSMPTNCVWVDGVAESVSEKYLSSQFNQFGIVAQVSVDRARGHALVFFEQLSCAQAAVKELRGVTLQRRRLQLDFASRECQEAFYAHLEKQGCSPGTWERPPAATFDAREGAAPRFESVPPAVTTPNARFPRYEAGARTTRGGGAAAAGPHPAHRGGSTTTGPTTRPNRNARQPPHPRFDYYDEFTSRFRSSSGEEYIPGHEDGGSYEQELRDYGFCQRERRTDYPAGVTGGDLEHSPSPAQLVGGDDVTPEEPAVVPARRHSRQHSSTTSDHGSPPPVRLTSPPASSKRLSGHSRLLSCSPRTPYYEDKEESKCKDPSPSPSSIISGSKCDLSSTGGGRGPHRHNDGKEPPPPPPPLPSSSSATRRHVENDSLPPPSNPVTEGDMTLHKERVHLKQLFDQIESNDSAAVKRVKLTAELKECGDNKDFRRIEPRRLSDLKGRRISTDSFSGKMGKDDKFHHRSDYAPHFIPKRRKTESSSEGGEGLHRDSSDGSRPGTPLCDERPECLVPSEPRRPRDRPSEGPISLPLPRFAHQLLTPRPGCGGPGKIVYTLKSPPPPPPNRHRTEQAPLRCEEKREPTLEAGSSEVPLSPSRPDSSSESERSPRASPILEELLDERLRMFDEKYQKWSGSRLSFSSEKTDTEKFKLRTKLPDLNELRNQPSEIVKSVLAKRSVFDEDTKRLENYNEKYEPKEFALTSWRSIAAASSSSSSTVSSCLTLATSIQNSKTEAKSGESWVPSTSTVSTIPLPTSSPSSVVTSPKSILVTSRSVPKSPFTTGTPTIPVVPPKAAPTPQAKPVMTPKTSAVPSPATSPRPSAKGLQYPFPSHPPVSSPVSLVPGSPRCQPPLSSPVQCSPAALDSGDWPPAQPPCLPTPPPSACGSPCIPPSTPAPPPSQPEESKSPPIASKTPVKKENNVLNATVRETVVASPAKSISSSVSTSSTPSLPSPSSVTSPLPPSTTPSATPETTTITTTTVVKKEPITTAAPASTTLSPPPTPVVTTPKVEPPPTPEKVEKPDPPPVVNCVHRKESSTPASKKESNGHKPHKSHSQDSTRSSGERRESVEERPRQKERRDSGKEHRPANVGNKRRISSQDEPRHTPAAAVEAPTVTGQPESKRPKLSSSSSEKSIEKVSMEKPAEKHAEKVVTEKPSEKPSEKSSSNPKPVVKVAPERRESKDSVRRVESSSSSSSSSSNKRSEERRKHDKDKDRKSEEKTKVSDEKSSHGERSKSHSSEKKAPENERHRSKERKRSKSERDRPRTEEKSARPRDEFRSKHETDDKNKKQRDKKSDRSSRRSESERRKERSTPKKSTSQSQASSTPAQPSAQPTPPQHPQSQHPAPQQQAPQQQSGQMQSNQQQALQLQQQQQQHHQHQQSMMPRDSAASDSDLSEDGRMKKHSIFDIVDDEPAYISMYDKVKARSTKNMQKQEEEKQKEKLKEKFNQLKQSRAKREEKKRSTSWDEDSDSDGGHHHHHKQLQERSGKTPKRPGKLVITSSSEEEGHNSRRRLLSDISHTDKSESDAEVLSRNKQRKSKLLKSELEGSDEDNEEGSARTKLMHAARRNFKPKITSDTSDYDEAMQQQQQQKYKPAFDIYSDSDDKQHHAMSTPVVAKVKTKENSRETFESSDEGKFDNKKHYDLAKFKHEFSENEAPNCIDKQPRKSHKSKRRPSGKSNCVEQPQLPVDDLEVRLERIDDAKLRLDHKRPSEEKQATPQPSGIDHKRSSAEPATNEYKRSSTESEHKRHSSSRRERRRSGHHEDKDETEAKASSRARKKKSKKDAVAKQEPSSKQRDDKMEDIFGPISDDSETGTANPTFHTEQSTTKSSNAANNNNNTQTYNPCPRKWQFNSVYSSDSDSNVDNAVIHRTSPSLPQLPEFEVENFGALDVNTSLKRSEERRRKRERRRSKERREKRLQREIRAERTDEELAEAGRVLESQLQTECSPPPPPPVPPPPVMPRLDEFRFTDDESASAESCERPKEKKKKRKRSKEERSRKDHHEKSSKSSESERKSSRGSEEPCSLPNLLPSPTSPAKVFSPEAKSFPKHFDDDDTLPVTEAAPSKPLVEKKRPDMKLIPGFGSEVDANIHETAVQSISSFPEEPVPIPEPAPTPPVVLLCPEPEEKEDKPRTVISQEETEDAVAALLEEKFDFAHYIDDGDDEEAVPHELHQEHVEPVLAAVQDEEQLASEEAQKETQQAVQSLECELPTAAVAPVVTEPVPEEESKDAERADTPQSEHDLQIDESAQPCSEDEAPVSPPPMPTLEQEEIEEPVSCPSPDTPEMMDFSRPPKTPDFPAAYYQQQQQQQQQLEASLETSLEKPVEEKLVVKEEQEVKETVVETPVVQPVTEVVKPPPSPEPLKPVEKPTEEPEVKKEVEVVPEPVKKVEEPELKVPEIIIPKEVVEEKVVEEKVVETIVPVLPEVEEKPVPPVEVPVEPVKPEVKIEVTPPEPSPPVAPVAPILQKAEELVEVKKEVVEPETVTPALLEVPQSPLRVRKVELSAPLIRDLAAQALQEAAAITPVPVPQAPATPVAAEEHEVPSHTEDETEEKVGETINTRCITRRGGRSRRGSKAVSRGGVSTRRTARGGGRTPRSDTAELSHTEESAEEKSGDITSPEHSQRGRKSRRGRKKKSVEPESGDDKGKSKMSSDTNDIYEFHDTDDEDLHYKSKPGEKIPVPAATVPTTTVSPPTPVKVDEAPTVAPTPPAPEEPVPEVPQHRRDSTTDDAASRPRLILTIKSPLKEGAAKVETREEFEQVAPPEVAATLVPAEPQATAPSPTPTIQQSPQPSHVAMNVKSPPGPTRKSRRLQEKDSSRSTVDDIIEEVIKGNFRAEEGGPTSPMHEARGGVTTRRSGRGTRLQRGSEEPQVPPRTARASSLTRPEEEKQQQPVAPPSVAKIELPKPAVAAAPSPTALPPQPQQQAQSAPPPSQKPQTAPVRVSPPVPRRAEEPTTLIDPVTGLLTPMRESGEGQYIPVTTSVSVIQAPPPASQQEHVVRPLVVKVDEKKAAVPVVRPPETPAQPPMQQQAPRPPAPQSPQRVPSATVAPAPRLVPPPPQVQRPVQQVSPTVVKLFNATTTAPPPTPAITVVKVQQPVVVSRPPVTATYTAPPRVVSEMGPGAPYPPWPTQAAPHTSPSRMSPLQQQTVAARVTAAPPQAHIPMAHASSLPSKQHLMESSSAQPPQPQGARPCLPQPAHSASAPERREHRRAKELTRRSLAEEELPLSMLPPRLRVGAVARTSAAAALPAPACSNTSAVAEPPRVEVGLGGCIVASGAPAQPRPPRARSRESPVGGGRPSMGHTATHSQVLQAGLPVPAYEASLGESVRVSPGQHAAAAAAAAAGFAPVAHLQQRPHDMAAQLLHNQQQFIYHQQLLRAQHEQQQLGPPPPSSAYHHQPYHLPPGPPGAARSPAVPGLDVKAEPPEASDEALALGPRGSRAPPSPPLELRRTATNARLAAAHLHSPHDRTTDSPQVATVYGARLVHHPHQGFQPRVAENDKLHAAPPLQPHRSNYMAPPQHPRYEEEGIFHHAPPPPAHHQRGVRGGHPTPGQEAPLSHPVAALQQPRLQVQTPPHASQVPPQADSLLMLLQRYPVVWQGLLALKNDQAAVQMHFVHGNPHVARNSLPCNSDGSTPPLRIAQRMRLEQTQLEGVARKMQMEQEHCMLLALPCGRDHMDVLQQSNNLKDGFITYLQQKQAAGIVNIPLPGSQQAAYVIHIFPSSDFANDNLARIAPDLLHRVSELSHLLIIIATV